MLLYFTLFCFMSNVVIIRATDGSLSILPSEVSICLLTIG